jgi:hypothetical protein
MGAAGIILVIIIIIAILVGIGWLTLGFNIQFAKGQTVEPPPIALPQPEPTPPAVVTPTPVPLATPTSPNPNFQYLPQKAYVQSFAPENGITNSPVPLQAIPQVIPVQQPTGGIDLSSMAGILATLGAGAAYLKGHFANKKAEAVKETTQSLAETNVQQAVVQQKTLEQVYENMPDKGASIHDKPEIKLEEVAKVKDEALKVATKA